MPSKTSRVVLRTVRLAALILIAVVGAGAVSRPEVATGFDSAVADWPASSRLASEAWIEQYGPPQNFSRNCLIWSGPGAWKRTVLRRSAAGGNILEQSVAYSVPNNKIAELRRFDARIRVDSQAHELSIRTGSPAANFLLANLAYELAGDLKTVPEARRFYAEQMNLSQAGKTSDYLVLLRFASRPDAPRSESTPRLGAPHDLELEQ
jgi:hypothetical protein